METKLAEYINWILNNPANFIFNVDESIHIYKIYNIKYRSKDFMSFKVYNDCVYDNITHLKISDYQDINWTLFDKHCYR